MTLAALHLALPGWRVREAILRAWSRLSFVSPRGLIVRQTMLPKQRLICLERSVRDVVHRSVAGEIVECGCARGGSAALLALCLQRARSDKKTYLFDTFEGLPEPTEHDPARARAWIGDCRGTLDEVQALFDELGIRSRAVFVKGLFQDTLASQAPVRIALLHLDGDWYESTKTCLEQLWPRLSPGGVLQVDDYGDWEGCKKAIDEFFAASGGGEPKHFIDPKAFWIMKQ